VYVAIVAQSMETVRSLCLQRLPSTATGALASALQPGELNAGVHVRRPFRPAPVPHFAQSLSGSSRLAGAASAPHRRSHTATDTSRISAESAPARIRGAKPAPSPSARIAGTSPWSSSCVPEFPAASTQLLVDRCPYGFLRTGGSSSRTPEPAPLRFAFLNL